MPSSFSHASVAIALGAVVAPRRLLRPFLIAGAVCAVMPDLDFVGPIGIELFGGHRGFTHSLAFAGLVGVASAAIVLRRPEWAGARLRFLLFIAIATATHGLLDAFTSVTRGVQLLSPFSLERHRAPLLRSGGQELVWLFVPSVVFAGLVLYLRGYRLPRFTRGAVLSIREEPDSHSSRKAINGSIRAARRAGR